MQLIWSPQARNEYYHTLAYIEDNFGRKAALTFDAEVQKRESWITENPTIGRIEPLLADRKAMQYRCLLVGKYNKFIYRVDGDVIRIADFWDMRQNPITLIRRVK